MNFIERLFGWKWDGFMPRRWGASSYYLNSTTPIMVDISDLMGVYACCPHLQTVINKKAEMFSNAQIRLVKEDNEEEIIDKHPILDLLKQPNVLQSTEEWLTQYSIYKDIYANAFIYKLSGIPGTIPKALWNFPPAIVEIVPTGKLFNQTDINGIIKEYRLIWADTKQTYQPEEIIHKTDMNSTRMLIGTSKILGLHYPISNIMGALKTRNILIHKKGAIGILSNETKDSDGGIPMTKEERERLEQGYLNSYGIGHEQAPILMTNSSVKWTPMSYPTRDLMLFEEVEEDFASILGAYGMNRDIFPSTKGATFENQKQAEQGTYNNTIQPEADDLMNTLTKTFGLNEQGLKLIADYSWLPIMQADKQKEQQVETAKVFSLSTQLRDGAIDLNEYREAMQYSLRENTSSQEQSQLDKIINAQVDLRGTVGGVTGLIEMNRAVGEGLLDRNSAVNIVMNIYGFDQSQAELMITQVTIVDNGND